MGDVEIQMLEQQRLIEQLKDMIRERDEEVKKKDTELKVSIATTEKKNTILNSFISRFSVDFFHCYA